MDSEHFDRRFDEIAHRLELEDSGLVRRLDRLRRREAMHVGFVFAFLSAAMVLLAVGFAVLSPIFWGAGLSAFIAAVLSDRQLRAT